MRLKQLLQQVLPGQRPDAEPKEDDDDGGHDEQHHEGDGDPDEGGGVEAEALGHGVEVDHDLLLVVLRQLELHIRRGHNLGMGDVKIKYNCLLITFEDLMKI